MVALIEGQRFLSRVLDVILALLIQQSSIININVRIPLQR